MTKYVPKRQAFDRHVMEARTCLAALDNNYSLGRQQKVNCKTGNLCYRLVFPKASAQWVVKALYEEKSYEWVKNLAETALQMCEKLQSNVEKENLSHKNEDAIDVTQKESRKDNIATLPRPDKEEAVSRHLSRFPHKGSTDKAPFKF